LPTQRQEVSDRMTVESTTLAGGSVILFSIE